MFHEFCPGKLVIDFHDLLKAGFVRSRYGLWCMIRDGKIRPPRKAGTTIQSSAYWLRAEIIEDLEKLYVADRRTARPHKSTQGISG